MTRDWQEWERFEREYAQTEQLTLEQKYAILNAMYEHARSLGVFPLKDPLDGFEHDIWLAKALNSV